MSKRQVIFLMTDTTRHDMVSCYGNARMNTPNIDSLADEGVLFEKAYSCQPVCGPARGAIFTGKYPHSNGCFTNTVPLWAGVKTIGDYLSGENVHSVYIGKWHLDGGDYFGNGICPPGYDPKYWFDMKTYLEGMSEEDRLKSRRESSSLEGGGIDSSFTFAHQIADRAVSFLENEGKDEDFFLCVSLDEPHQPYLCPEPYASMFEDYELPITPAYHDTLEDKPMLERLWAGKNLEADKSDLHIRPQLFLGCNSYADSQLGRVIDAARRHCPDALVIFTSDHGEALGAHSLSLKGPSVYEEICHIPLMVKGGSESFKAAVRKRYKGVASHIDLVPTILDYYSIPAPPDLDGVSMRSVIENPEGPELHEAVFTEFHRYEIDHDGFGGLQFMRAAITPRHKMALHLTDTDELFDTEKDPHEVRNEILNPEYAEVRKALHEYILKTMNDTRDPFRGYQWKCRHWNDEKPDWEVDGYTRQRPTGPGEDKQLDYDTGLPITECVRPKIKAKKPAGAT